MKYICETLPYYLNWTHIHDITVILRAISVQWWWLRRAIRYMWFPISERSLAIIHTRGSSTLRTRHAISFGAKQFMIGINFSKASRAVIITGAVNGTIAVMEAISKWRRTASSPVSESRMTVSRAVRDRWRAASGANMWQVHPMKIGKQSTFLGTKQYTRNVRHTCSTQHDQGGVSI